MNEFKFELGDKVFILGCAGKCLVSGRGRMEFTSGGKMNYYFLQGAYSGPQPEDAL